MKKYSLLSFILIMLCSMFTGVPVSSVPTTVPEDVVVNLQLGHPIMEVNGVDEEIDPGRGTAPVVVNGRTLVPIRAIIEAFGGNVSWNGKTQMVTLTLKDEEIRLVIGSNKAYLNDTPYSLDVAPAAINERTMLPLRFVAEGFNLGVAWDGETQTVSVVRNHFEDEEYQTIMSMLPAYSGKPYVELNNNIPFFEEYEIISGSFEYYSDLDELGRCDVCMASISTELMPTGERESISSVTPTGWINKQYDNVDGGYLYNRCHLIGYQLTGENANERNLITGTRALNVNGMLPFENEIDDYIESTGNNVMYRVTPVFTANNLVADGVLIEAYSVEDNGAGICFNVYCYNAQPGITINYANGNSFGYSSVTTHTPSKSESKSQTVYTTATGKKYHSTKSCSGLARAKNIFESTLGSAQGQGLDPCSLCY